MAYRYKLGDKSYEKAETLAAFTFLLPTFIALVFLFFIPTLRVFSLSFTDTNTITGVSKFVGLGNFRYLLKNQVFLKSIRNTFIFTTVKLTSEITISLALAVMLDAKIPFRKFLRINYFAPVVVPVVASSTVWLWLYAPNFSPLNQILETIGLSPLKWIYSAENVFLAGMAAFFTGSSTKISSWTQVFGDDLLAIPMPYFTEQAVSLGGNTVSIFPSSNDAKTDAAWEFVRYITSTKPNAKFAINSGYLPIRKSALELSEMKAAFAATPAYETAFMQLEHAFSYVNIDSFSALDNAIINAIDKVTDDTNYDPAKAMREAAIEYDLEAEGR